MILAVSRFRVANGMEDAVRDAFLNRPHLVDEASGFLGMETFNGESADEFYLVTRWTDAASFHAWHKSPAHHLSHKLMPRGLKLDASRTKLVLLERLESPKGCVDLEETVADAFPFLARYLAASRSIHFLAVDAQGIILSCSAAVPWALGRPAVELVGSSLWDRLADTEPAPLKARVQSGRRFQQGVLINFLDAGGRPFALQGWLDVYPDGFVFLGEAPTQKQSAMMETLMDLNNRLAVLTRERAHQNKALARAHEELEQAHRSLETSNWHLKKIQEVLPICMRCGKVKTGEHAWESLLKFFQENSDFLSHSYCPECYAQVEREWGFDE